jgi:hypothetical protein
MSNCPRPEGKFRNVSSFRYWSGVVKQLEYGGLAPESGGFAWFLVRFYMQGGFLRINRLEPLVTAE